MKKIGFLMILLLLTGAVMGCSAKKVSETEAQSKAETTAEELSEKEPEDETEAPTYYNIAMITGGNDSILDGGMYQSAWKGLVSYAETQGVSHHYYAAETEDAEAISGQIAAAVEAGAKTVIGFGNEMYEAVHVAAKENPNVEFCVIDATGKTEASGNVTILEYDRMEVGFVAGYAAAMEGIDTIGFFSYGKMLENEYEYGFVQGLDMGGKFMTRNKAKVYTISFGASGQEETMRETLQEWFTEKGVQLVFCSSDAQMICSEMASQNGASLVTAGDSALLGNLAAVDGIITRNYEKAVYDYLYGSYDKGHHYLNMGSDMIHYEKKEGTFPSFTEAIQEDLIQRIEDSSIDLNRNVRISAADLGLEYVEFLY